MANILSIATAVPPYCHQQSDILNFMQSAYELDDVEKRKLSFLYHRSGINTRHSVIPDFSNGAIRTFLPDNSEAPFPNLDMRMQLYHQHALPLALEAIKKCVAGKMAITALTHIITVSCTGMSAPGLDIDIVEALDLAPHTYRTSVNFMGCYAAIHALKMADMICKATPTAQVMIVCVELCTLHFQKEYHLDNAASSLLFADGAAAILISNQHQEKASLQLKGFYSHIAVKGKNDMSWKLSNKGFLMTLSSYIPQLIQADIADLVSNALSHQQLTAADVTHWCIHPGGKAIIEAIQKQLHLTEAQVQYSRNILANYGNMSSASILFVLEQMLQTLDSTTEKATVFGVAFGPGLTMETFIAEKNVV